MSRLAPPPSPTLLPPAPKDMIPVIFIPPPQSPSFFINEVISSSFLPRGGREEEEGGREKGVRPREEERESNFLQSSEEAEVRLPPEIHIKKRKSVSRVTSFLLKPNSYSCRQVT